MKKYIIKIILFAVCIISIDFAFGVICEYLNTNATDGETKRHYYAALETHEDIIILGSSRATHHYVSSILQDSLNMSVYNAGTVGNGIIYLYGRLKLITNRYTPKVIIYDAYADYDIMTNDNYRYLHWLKRFYDKPGIDSIFHDICDNEKYKMKSNLYRYNTSFFQLISDNIIPQHKNSIDGYKPLYGEISYNLSSMAIDSINTYDPMKYKYFTKLVNLCKQRDIQLIISLSPMYKATSSSCFKMIKDICEEYNIPIIDFYADRIISNNAKYFIDSSHMNHLGAQEFTSAIAPLIKEFSSK